MTEKNALKLLKLFDQEVMMDYIRNNYTIVDGNIYFDTIKVAKERGMIIGTCENCEYGKTTDQSENVIICTELMNVPFMKNHYCSDWKSK